MAADIITLSRVPFSLLLFAFPPGTPFFAACYLWCGFSDVLDGFVARKLHTQSERGAILDSAADLLFAVVYAVRILPLLSIPLWVWIWAAAVAVTKITGILIAGKRTGKLRIEHSPGNKLTGVLLFFLPLSVGFADVTYGAALVCAVATVTVAWEMIRVCGKANHRSAENRDCPKTNGKIL